MLGVVLVPQPLVALGSCVGALLAVSCTGVGVACAGLHLVLLAPPRDPGLFRAPSLSWLSRARFWP